MKVKLDNELLNEILILLGIALIGWGAFEVYRPAGFISVGLLLSGIGVLGAYRGIRHR